MRGSLNGLRLAPVTCRHRNHRCCKCAACRRCRRILGVYCVCGGCAGCSVQPRYLHCAWAVVRVQQRFQALCCPSGSNAGSSCAVIRLRVRTCVTPSSACHAFGARHAPSTGSHETPFLPRCLGAARTWLPPRLKVCWHRAGACIAAARQSCPLWCPGHVAHAQCCAACVCVDGARSAARRNDASHAIDQQPGGCAGQRFWGLLQWMG